MTGSDLFALNEITCTGILIILTFMTNAVSDYIAYSKRIKREQAYLKELKREQRRQQVYNERVAQHSANRCGGESKKQVNYASQHRNTKYKQQIYRKNRKVI